MSMEETKEQIKKDIQENRVILYMKGNKQAPQCGFSAQVVDILNHANANYETRDVLQDESLRQAIKDHSNWPTLPQLYIDGEFIGGCDIVRELYQNGELQKKLEVGDPPGVAAVGAHAPQVGDQTPLVEATPDDPMSIKCSVYIAASLDNFIARPDGGIDWLENKEYAPAEGDDFGFSDFMKSVDYLVMGRGTFDKLSTFENAFTPEGWPYGEIPLIILSNRELDLPEFLAGKASVENTPPKELVARLESEGAKRLYIDGGKTIQRFLRENLINEITITRFPILLGDGLPLFGAIGVELPLTHLHTKSFQNGFVQSSYAL